MKKKWASKERIFIMLFNSQKGNFQIFLTWVEIKIVRNLQWINILISLKHLTRVIQQVWITQIIQHLILLCWTFKQRFNSFNTLFKCWGLFIMLKSLWYKILVICIIIVVEISIWIWCEITWIELIFATIVKLIWVWKTIHFD